LKNSEPKIEHKILEKILFKLVSKHIGGITLSSLLVKVRENEKNKIHTTITFLNEDPTKARYNANTYIQLIKQIVRLHINADLSIRLSQLGYGLNNSVFNSCFQDILNTAKAEGIKCWIESEKNIKTEELLTLYRTFNKNYKNLGVEISLNYPLEVNLIKKYIRNKDNIKLTSYFLNIKNLDNKDIKSDKKSKLNNNNNNNNELYDGKYLLERYISDAAKLLQAGTNVVVLESNEKIAAKIASFGREYKKNIIFELPYGSSKKWISKLIKMKVNISFYIPYGKDWIHYVTNRLTYGHHKVSAITAKFLELNNYKENSKKQIKGENNAF
jgi:proline dehydrogenase